MSAIRLGTTAVHAGAAPDEAFGELSVPIHQASLFELPSAEEGAAIHEGAASGYVYGRIATPTQTALERCVATLEGGDGALATASGMAAISLSLLSVLEPGNHLLAQSSLYTSTLALLEDMIARLGVEVGRFDGTRLDTLEAAVRPSTRAIFLETPANPRLSIVDIEQVVAVARTVGATVIVDSTFASPINQRPLDLGADVVVHSATKYLGGHGDLVAGVLIGTKELAEIARWKMMRMLGPVIAPHTAWLVLRGIRTLSVRMERHNANALQVAAFLEGHPSVRSVYHPGLASHPQHELARRQMHGFGGVVAFEVESARAARRLIDALELITCAVSLGDVASVIQHAATMTQASLSEDERTNAGVSDGLVRLSVGIEDAADIIDDLAQALAGLERVKSIQRA